MKVVLIVLFQVIFINYGNCQYSTQGEKYKQLLNSVVSEIIFVNVEPLKKLDLHNYSVNDFRDYLKTESGQIDTSIFIQILNNSVQPDTSNWLCNELGKAIIIRDTNQELNIDSVLKKINLKSEKEVRRYKNIFNNYNSISPAKRLIFSYSKPVFDNSKKYAVIRYSYLGKGQGITLYHYESDTWKELTDISDRF